MSFQFGDLLSFDKMVTPVIIKVIYWLGIAAIVISSLATLFSGQGLMSVVMGLCLLVFGILFWRVWCELMIVMFNIYDALRTIRDRGNGLN